MSVVVLKRIFLGLLMAHTHCFAGGDTGFFEVVEGNYGGKWIHITGIQYVDDNGIPKKGSGTLSINGDLKAKGKDCWVVLQKKPASASPWMPTYTITIVGKKPQKARPHRKTVDSKTSPYRPTNRHELALAAQNGKPIVSANHWMGFDSLSPATFAYKEVNLDTGFIDERSSFRSTYLEVAQRTLMKKVCGWEPPANANDESRIVEQRIQVRSNSLSITNAVLCDRFPFSDRTYGVKLSCRF